MKNLLTLLCAATLCITLSSCSSDQDIDQLVVIPERIEGTWDLVSFSIEEGVITSTTSRGSVEEDFTMQGVDFDGYINFTPHPYNYDSQGSFTCEMTIGDSQEPVIAVEQLDLYFGFGDWDVNGDRLTKHFEEGDSVNFTITDFSDEFMKVSYDLVLVESTEEGNITKKGKAYYTLKKRT